MRTILAIGLGSGIGGVLRYLLSLLVQLRTGTDFPLGTLLVNVVGSFAIGIVFGLAEGGSIGGAWRLYLATGLIGGFTTFSAFSLETVQLLSSGRVVPALLYVSLSLLLGLLATCGGLCLARP